MYQIWGQNDSELPFLLWASDFDSITETVIDPQLTREIGKSGSCSFSIMPNHSWYNKIIKMVTRIRINYDDEIIFYGRVLNTTADEYNQLQIDCEGALSFLNDSIIEPSEQEETIEDHFRRIIESHNKSVDSWKQFKIGKVTIENKTTNVKFGSSSYGSAIDALEDQMTGPYGGFLETRLESDGLYLDWIGEYTSTTNQVIEFGGNLITLSNKISGEDLCTVLYPFGKDNIDISSVNNGVKYLKTPLFDAYGWVAKTVQFDDIVTSEALIARANDYIATKFSELPQEIVITSLDTHLLDQSKDTINIGDLVYIDSKPNGIQKSYICVSIEYDFFNPENNSYTFGDPNADRDESLSQNYSSYVQATNRMITNNYTNTLKYYKELNDKVEIAAKDISLVASDTLELKAKTATIEAENVKIKSDLYEVNSNHIQLVADIEGLDQKYEENTSQIITVGNQVIEIEKSTNELNQAVLDLDGDVATLQGNVVQLQGNITTIEGRTKVIIDGKEVDVNAGIISLKGSQDALTGDVNDLRTAQLLLKDEYAKLSADYTVIAGNHNILVGDVNALDEETGELKKGVQENGTAILKLQGDHSVLSANVNVVAGNQASLIGRVDAVDEETGELKKGLDEHGVAIFNAQNDIATIDGRVLNIETVTTNLNSSITNINGQQANTTSNIINLIGQKDAIDPETGLIKQEVIDKGIAIIQVKEDVASIGGRVLNVETTTTNLNSEVTNIKNAVAQKASITDLEAATARINNLTTGVTTASVLAANTIRCGSIMMAGATYANGIIAVGAKMTRAMIAGAGMTIGAEDLPHSHKITVAEDGTVTLGEVVTGSQNFNIADTAFYKAGVSAVGFRDVLSLTTSYNSDHNYYTVTIMGVLSNGKTFTIKNHGFTATDAYNAGYNAGVYAVKTGLTVSATVSVGRTSATQVTAKAEARTYYGGKQLAYDSESTIFNI